MAHSKSINFGVILILVIHTLIYSLKGKHLYNSNKTATTDIVGTMVPLFHKIYLDAVMF